MTAAPARGRDPRLDVFRGLAMCIILLAHMRWTVLADYIPARFGLSDAAEMFVFLSGCASAIAFGGTFRRSGFLVGTARIAHRCWQLYLSHLMLFFVVAALAAGASAAFASPDYFDVVYITWFFADPASALIRLFSLSYVPAYLDIMPVYIVVLALVPAMMALARIHVLLAPAASVALYLAANATGWNFLADPTDGRGWFLNPFAWQLVFFAGFSLSSGWIAPPPPDRRLLQAAVGVLLVGLVVKLPGLAEWLSPIAALSGLILDHSDKTLLDPMRFVHFLSAAYVVHCLFEGRTRVLEHPLLRPLRKIGQQALPSFLFSIVLSNAGGIAFDQLGAGWTMQVLINAAALGLLVGGAYVVAWFKSTPWKRPAAALPAETSPPRQPAFPTAARWPALAVGGTSVVQPEARP